MLMTHWLTVLYHALSRTDAPVNHSGTRWSAPESPPVYGERVPPKHPTGRHRDLSRWSARSKLA
ncbi:MAG: hypothetical protein ACREIV_13600 [Planctomycetaceae bacterium]